MSRTFRQFAFPNPDDTPIGPAQGLVHQTGADCQNQFDKQLNHKYFPGPTELRDIDVMKQCVYCGRENEDNQKLSTNRNDYETISVIPKVNQTIFKSP